MAFDPIAFIASQKWVFAKTRPFNPHEYIVRGKGNDPEDFWALALHIFEHGERRIWGNKIYICWYPGDGYRYWTMGWPKSREVTLNRAHDDHEQTTPPMPNTEYPYSSPDGLMPDGLRLVNDRRAVPL